MSGERIDVVCPSDGLVFASVPASGKADVDRAVTAARAAFDAGPWSRMPAFERGRCLTRLGLLVEKNATELAALESRDTGKPVRQGHADVAATLRYFEFYGGAADKIHGDTIPFLDGYTALTLREPHGVVAGIVPWNYPLQILARVVGAALAMGNTLVAKPAEDASLTTIRMAELALEAGFPEGVFNVVTGYGREAGAALSGHPLVDYVTFTGSPPTGTAIQQAAAVNNRGVTMELGGKSPQIVFADADIAKAAPALVNAIIQNGGQTCSAGSRVLVERPVYEAVAAELVRAVFGARRRPARCRPRPRRADQRAAEGTRRGDGGRMPRRPAPGCWRAAASLRMRRPAATILRRCCSATSIRRPRWRRRKCSARCWRCSPSTPKMRRSRWRIRPQYGLVAGIWTKDGARQHRVAKRVRAGQVFVNAYGAGGGVELPFGGFGKSGHGREKGFEALYDMSATKTIVFNHG